MGYDVYDLGFRTYYPAIGRFTSIDPLAEGFLGQSPYVYAANNPVRYIDFLGLAATNPPTDLTHGNNDIFIDGGIFGDGTGSFNPFMNGCGLPIYNGFFNFDRFGKFIPPMLNLTVVNSSGKILYHDPNAKKADGSYDDRILVASDGWKKSDGFDGLQQIGTERAGNKYKKGTYLDQYSYDYIDNEGNECTMLASAIAFAISGYGQIRVHVDQKGGYIINPGGNWGKGIFWGFAEKVFGWFNFNVAIGRFRPSIAGEVLQVPNIFLNMGQNIGGEVQQMMSEPDMIRTNLKFYFDRQHYYFDKYVFDTIIPATDTLKSNIIKNVTDHRPAGVVIYNVYPE